MGYIKLNKESRCYELEDTHECKIKYSDYEIKMIDSNDYKRGELDEY